MIKKKKLYGPFLWMGFNLLKATATSRRLFTFYHSVPRNSWYSFYWPRKDERLSRPWSHPVVLNTGPLDWQSIVLTTWPFLHRENSDTQFIYCSLYHDCFLHFRYGTSIYFKPILWKNCFLPKRNIGLKWIKHIANENHHNKTWLFFLWNWQEQLMLQKITMSSCNETLKQVLSFLSNLASALFLLRIALSSHLCEIWSKFPN